MIFDSKRTLVPCLDVRNGRTLEPSGINGLKDPCDPLEIATLYGNLSSTALFFLDIFDKHEKARESLPLIRSIAAAIKAPMNVMVERGTIDTLDDIEPYLEAGAQTFILNNSAVARPAVVAEAVAGYGSDRIIGGIAAKPAAPGHWEHCIGVDRTGTGLDAVEWAKRLADMGVTALVVTSVKQEGTGQGFEAELTRAVSEAVDIPVIASGGMGKVEHLGDILSQGGAKGLLVNANFFNGQIPLAEADAYLSRYQEAS